MRTTEAPTHALAVGLASRSARARHDEVSRACGARAAHWSTSIEQPSQPASWLGP